MATQSIWLVKIMKFRVFPVHREDATLAEYQIMLAQVYGHQATTL